MKDRLDNALTALQKITDLGANPLTKHGCRTNIDFSCLRHIDKMYEIASIAISKDLEMEYDDKERG